MIAMSITKGIGIMTIVTRKRAKFSTSRLVISVDPFVDTINRSDAEEKSDEEHENVRVHVAYSIA